MLHADMSCLSQNRSCPSSWTVWHVFWQLFGDFPTIHALPIRMCLKSPSAVCIHGWECTFLCRTKYISFPILYSSALQTEHGPFIIPFPMRSNWRLGMISSGISWIAIFKLNLVYVEMNGSALHNRLHIKSVNCHDHHLLPFISWFFFSNLWLSGT